MKLRQSANFLELIGQEKDACALYAAVSKMPPQAGLDAVPLWVDALSALIHMEHRAGQRDGRTDGTGLLTTLPRELWQRRLKESPMPVDAEDPRFWVITLVTPIADAHEVTRQLAECLLPWQFRVLAAHWDLVDGDEGLYSHGLYFTGERIWETRQFGGALDAVEERFPGKIAAFSRSVAVLKMRHGAKVLGQHAHQLWKDAFYPRALLGHNRFSTNTTTDLCRVQPFLGLAHNGEINTIDRLVRELEAIGMHSVTEGSDSQNLDRLLVSLETRYGFDASQALRLALAPSPAYLDQLPLATQQQWAKVQAFWGPVAEGPAAVVYLREGQLVAAVDALGLRPLWLLETRSAYVFSSEPGVVNSDDWVAEPRPLGPGEIVALTWEESGPVRVTSQGGIESNLLQRTASLPSVRQWEPCTDVTDSPMVPTGALAANGWRQDDLVVLRAFEDTGRDPVGSLGFDGPIGCLYPGITNIADYLQETVAVVTNPALDREREVEHFRLQSYLSARPGLDRPTVDPVLLLSHPWLRDTDLLELEPAQKGAMQRAPLVSSMGKAELECANDLGQSVVARARQGASVVVLDDGMEGGGLGLDPVLGVAGVDQALRQAGLRRAVRVIVRSAAIRHLHDAIILLGLGADALVPYAMWAQVQGDHYAKVVEVMNQGLEKILSTMGTHELSGYGRNFSAIGLPVPVAHALGVVSYAPPSYREWCRKRSEMRQARHQLIENSGTSLRLIPHNTNYVYKAALSLAEGRADAHAFQEVVAHVEQKYPSQIHHLLRVSSLPHLGGGRAQLNVGSHALPFVISSMSFGSQGESSFRSYARAAQILNMVAMNGEGGEIPDMVGQYYRWRGYQIASGRFGINAKLINGAQYVEIKIGQGAKPGEGGHLPGSKVSQKVAQARRAQFGVDLISPSNNHDLYSIEDLKQLIDELKEVNPDVKVVVKVPVVPNIGTIAIGIVKAGADIVNLSGFDGGTGAARLHALRHVGLPIDIGLPVVHAALTAAGLRDRVEIWADGGMRSGADVMKMVLLGANRVGFGTMAMVALGCTICRHCQKDTCHVGITTQMESLEEAAARGLKRFQLQDGDRGVAQLVRFFRGLGEQLAEQLEGLGLASITEAVGNWQWLESSIKDQSLPDYQGFLEDLSNGMTKAQDYSVVAGGGDYRGTMRGPGPIEPHLSASRTLGTAISGRRARRPGLNEEDVLKISKVAGQGFGAFLHPGVRLMALGGAQDGLAKSASGGRVAVMKTKNSRGEFFGGHAGKSVAYGAQGGTIIVQGSADARAGIRLAGAHLIIMGDGVPTPRMAKGFWDSAVIKGFGFEYMTRGLGLVLGDPGPWLASGMTGGCLYLRYDENLGLTREFLQSRIAKAAKVHLIPATKVDVAPIQELLGTMFGALKESNQEHRGAEWMPLWTDPTQHFLKLVAEGEQADPEVSTE